MAKSRLLNLQPPLGGLNKRLSLQRQAPFTTFSCLNVWPDDCLGGRERMGSRPGIAKAFAQQVGSGNPVRVCGDVRYVNSGVIATRFWCISNGIFHWEASAGTLSAHASSLRFADRQLDWCERAGKVYIADYSTPISDVTDGVLAGSGTNEVQTITMTATGGTFIILFKGVATSALAFDVSTADMQTALVALSSIGTGGVTVSGSAGSSYVLTFAGSLAATDVEICTLNVASLTGGSASIVETTKGRAAGDQLTSATTGDFAAAGVDADDHVVVIYEHAGRNAVQTITLPSGTTGGTFTISYGGSTTTALAYNASAATVQTALEALASITPGDVIVSGSGGGPYTLTFGETLGLQPIVEVVGDGTLLTGGATTITVATTTDGKTTTEAAGSYPISSVSTTTITLAAHPYLFASTGVKFYIQRGIKVFDPVANTITLLTADTYDDGTPKGSVPVGKLIERWRDRIVVSGDDKFGNIWYMSRAGDDEDWDYFPEADDVARAVAAANSDAGEVGENVTALIHHSDDCLIFGCTNSLWIARGDPAYGGQLDRLSGTFGVTGMHAFAYDAEGVLYFISHDGLYAMQPGCGSTPVSISRERLPEELLNLDPATYTISMGYDVRFRGLLLMLTKASGPTTNHWFIDTKLTSGGVGFFPISYAAAQEAFSIHSRRSVYSDHSLAFLGGRTGYIYQHKVAQLTDDGTNFSSYYHIGPIQPSGEGAYIHSVLSELIGTPAASSGDVTWNIYQGNSAQEASTASSADTGTWTTTGRQHTHRPRVRGGAFFIKLSNGENGAAWAMEALQALFIDAGKARVL